MRVDERARTCAEPSVPLGRILKAVDFKTVLARPSSSRSPHFALHHTTASPALPSRAGKASNAAKLSTDAVGLVDRAVDILCSSGAQMVSLAVDGMEAGDGGAAAERSARPVGTRVWVGLVVPKRHAKRSVTRTLMKRQICMTLEAVRDRLQPGMWVVRLRAPFPKGDFPSASSMALKSAVRGELARLVAQAVRAPVSSRSAIAQLAAVGNPKSVSGSSGSS